MRALITGGSGFVGRRLTRALVRRGDEVDLTGLADSFDASSFLSPDQSRHVRWMSADARSADDVDAVVAWSEPDVVFHLAAVAFPPEAERSPEIAYDVNTLGIVRLLSALRRLRPGATVLVVGTAIQYGRHEASEMPLAETAAMRPATVYAASKAAQEIAALQFALGAGMRVICTRSFNHSGPGQQEQYLMPSLVARALRLRADGGGSLSLGNDVVRDFLHVDDVVTAYLLLAERGVPGEVYNVCSGIGVSVRELAERVLLRLGIAADISTEPSLVRTADVAALVGSPAKLQRDTGWATTKTHDDIIDDLLHAKTG
ncbi:MAG TPA: GDP-mannose 4,6-dehydratase [Gemmatimonadaceae bacterium]